jgi:uncharacterized protein (TIGR03000 family)
LLRGLTVAALLLLPPSLISRAPAQDVPADKALIVVRLPAGATLTVGGQATRMTGAERTFLSPTLEPGKSYTYDLEATWTENGQAKKARQTVKVQAGRRAVVEITAGSATAEGPRPADGKARSFLFTYAATITGLAPGQKARIWLPVPPTNGAQEVKLESESLPAEPRIGREAEYGNEIAYLEATADADGKIPLSRTYRVTRREVRGQAADEAGPPPARLLQPDRLVPLEGKPLELLRGKPLPADQTEAARVMYETVNKHMRYSKEGQGWGRGDAVWACDSKYGNCTDFHSLFISLARANRIPAKFEIGFPIPEKRGEGEVGGYHCWAFFRPSGRGWVPVDISEANKNPELTDYYFGNLTEDRVTFSTGRDLTLVPKQAAGPVNFLVYPYVEVGGKPLPPEKAQKKFTYKDLK